MKKIKKEVSFLIDHIDPLGQGVSKISDKITFIPGTLPGEQGLAEIVFEQSKIQFGKVIDFKKKSELRVEPECSHFESCNGCHYLHTKYQNETQLKFSSAAHFFKNLIPEDKIRVHASKERFHYRNRIQLHYDLKKSALGFKAKKSNKIHKVPHCLLPTPKIKLKMDELYHGNSWRDLVKNEKKIRGHIELYELPNELKVSINENYASGGFSQVSSESEQVALKLISNSFSGNYNHILELFGGAGKLSKGLSFESRSIVDLYSPSQLKNSDQKTEFVSLDLFECDASSEVLKLPSPDLVIIDPPRSGYKQLGEIVKGFPTKAYAYLSCNPLTLARDLNEIAGEIELLGLHFIDFFPGTFHVEALAFFRTKTLK